MNSIHDVDTTNAGRWVSNYAVGDDVNNTGKMYTHSSTGMSYAYPKSSWECYEGKENAHLFFPGFLASSSLNFSTALPLNLPPSPFPSSSSMFALNLLLSVRLGWLELPLPPRISENLLDLPFPPVFVLVVTVVVCNAKAGIENLFFLLTVSSRRFGEAETFHLTLGGGLNSGLVGDSSTFSVSSALSGENSPDVEIEVDRYPLAPAVVKPPIPLFTFRLEGSRLPVWPAEKPDPDGLPWLKSSRIWR